MMTNLLNPKALVFFVSLLSSLIPASMSVSGKVSAALILVGLSLTWFSCLAWLLTRLPCNNACSALRDPSMAYALRCLSWPVA